MTQATRTLILVRHAKSSWKNPGLDDHDRPLNKRGKRDAPNMGYRLAQLGPHPQLIVSSSAKRAVKTARKIAVQLGYERRSIQVTSEIYHASARELLATARRFDPDFDCIMMVGHNPGLTDFLELLTGAGIDNIPTCGVAVIALPDWRACARGGGELLRFDTPKGIFADS